VGISQATQFKDMFITAAYAILLVTVLDALWLVSNSRWFEQHADQVSVHATLARSQAKSMRAKAKTYLDCYSAVTA
jgi:hypothetical protein